MSNTLAEQIINAIREAFGPGPLALHEPSFNGNELAYLKECIDSTFVSSVGPFVDRFEADLANYTGAKHAVAVVNGTAALHIALKLSGVQAGDEVLIPALTFVATANAVSYCGAIPHFVESDEITLGIDPYKLREYLSEITELRNGVCVNKKTNRVIRTLVPMHTFGHPVDMEGVLAVAKDYHLMIVEDAAESLGSTYYGQHTGTFGLMGVLSFNGNKTITTGGGGAILTNDSALAKRAKHLTTTAKIPHKWEFNHDEIGYNYRMPNLNAALGCAQLEQLPLKLKAKRMIFQRYQSALINIKGVYLVKERNNCFTNYWLQTLVLDKATIEQRNIILSTTNNAGFMTRPAWNLICQLPQFSNCPAMKLLIAQKLTTQLVNLPSSMYSLVD